MPDTMVQTDLEDPEYLGRPVQPTPKRAAPKSATVTISNKTFAAALGRAVAITGRSKTVPILECVRLQIDDGTLIVEANNMEQMLRQKVAVNGTGSGIGCVKAATLHSIIQKLPADEECALEFEPTTLSVRCGRSRLSLELLALDDYPIFALGHSPTRFTMASADLATIIGRTRPFVSNEVTRYYLCGILLAAHQIEGTAVLRAVATNGNWLGAAWTAMPEGAAGMPNVILPAVSIPSIADLISGSGEVGVALSDVRAVFSVGETTFATKLIDGTYPEVDRAIPRDNPNVLRVDRRAFLQALAVTSVDMGDRDLILKLSLSADAFALSAGHGVSRVTHEMPDGSFEYDGVPMEIGFMNRILTEPAKQCGARIEFRFRGPEHFASACDPEDDAALYVIGSYRI